MELVSVQMAPCIIQLIKPVIHVLLVIVHSVLSLRTKQWMINVHNVPQLSNKPTIHANVERLTYTTLHLTPATAQLDH